MIKKFQIWKLKSGTCKIYNSTVEKSFSQLKELKDPARNAEIDELSEELVKAVNATKVIKKSITVGFFGLF